MHTGSKVPQKGVIQKALMQVYRMMEMIQVMEICILIIMRYQAVVTKWLAESGKSAGIVKEVIVLYQPDLLYTDGTLPFGDNNFEMGLKIAAHLYNTNEAVLVDVVSKNGNLLLTSSR